MSAQKYVLWFHEIDRHDGPIAGGKGANLGEMTQAKLPVPPGFVVTAQAYYHFIDSAKLKPKIAKILHGLDYEDSTALRRAAKKVQALIIQTPIPAEISLTIARYYYSLSNFNESQADPDGWHHYHRPKLLTLLEKKLKMHQATVAIRSSATAEDLPEASFAGQQETFLNIKGEANVVHKVKEAWASLFTSRAIYYRQENKFDHFKVGIATPVQLMIASETSGVMFTVDPITNDKKHLVIEAIYGLGEMIVQGAVTPDHYLVEKDTLKIVQKEVGRQAEFLPGYGLKPQPVKAADQSLQKISDEQIRKIAAFGRKIEGHYYFPQDIEWAITDNKIYILQTRPITTLKTPEAAMPPEKINLKVILKGQGASPGIASGRVVIIHSPAEISKIKNGDILVAMITNPDFVPAMRRAAAIVTEMGGRTSHAAIVSRELGVPCIVGTAKALSLLKTGDEITVDAKAGLIYQGLYVKTAPATFSDRQFSTTRQLKTATKVYVNLAEVDRAEAVAKMNVDGVGLLRAEFMIAESGSHPKQMIKDGRQQVFIDSLAEKISRFCKAFGPNRPVIYRTSDFKTNEYRNLKNGAQFEKLEENPMLGFRGAFRYIKDAAVFEMELAALKRVRHKLGHRNLQVMLPFVRSPEELQQVKRIMAAAGLNRSPSFKLYMMVEIPVNVIRLEDFIKVGIDGVSIGSNDLTQLIMGLDRDNGLVAELFDERNPAVYWALEKTIKTCHQYDISSSICGQAPSDYPELVSKLVQWGITGISVNPDAVDAVRERVYRAESNLVKK